MIFRKSLDVSEDTDHHDLVAQQEKKPGRGGARPGAGRKRIVRDPERIAVDLEKSDLVALRALSKRRETSVADLVRRAVKQYLNRTRKG